MPDDATATAELTETQAPPSPDGQRTELPIPEPTQQEPAPEGEKPEGAESGAAPPEDAEPDVSEELKNTIAELHKEHPELFPAPPQQEPSGDMFEVERERLKLDRDRRKEQAVGYFQQTYVQSMTRAAPAIQELQRAAAELVEGKQESLSRDALGSLGQGIDAVRQDAANAAFVYARTMADEDALDALQSHASYRYLSADERKQLAEMHGTEGWVQKALHLQLDAALERGAPEEVKRAEKKKAEDTAKLAEKLQALKKMGIGTNGKQPEVGSAKTKSELTVESARELPIQEVIAIRNRQKAAQ